MCNASANGDCYFVSYRDPNLKRTNEIYDGIPDYLAEFDANEREMTKYVIGTMSTVDTPLTPSLKGARDMNAWLTGTCYEEIQKAREEGISYSCDSKYTKGHKCAEKKLFYIDYEEEEEKGQERSK